MKVGLPPDVRTRQNDYNRHISLTLTACDRLIATPDTGRPLTPAKPQPYRAVSSSICRNRPSSFMSRCVVISSVMMRSAASADMDGL
jgi:hypothetical protein